MKNDRVIDIILAYLSVFYFPAPSVHGCQEELEQESVLRDLNTK